MGYFLNKLAEEVEVKATSGDKVNNYGPLNATSAAVNGAFSGLFAHLAHGDLKKIRELNRLEASNVKLPKGMTAEQYRKQLRINKRFHKGIGALNSAFAIGNARSMYRDIKNAINNKDPYSS